MTRGVRREGLGPGLRRDAVCAAAAAAAAVLVYLPALPGAFAWDDWILIVRHPAMNPGGPSLWEALTSDFWRWSVHKLQVVYWRPLVVLDYWLERQLFGDWAGGYHAVNLVWHAAATAGVYACARTVARSRVVATGAALLFAVFPPSAEAVAWIGGRPDPMVAALVLPALALFVRACKRARAGDARTADGAAVLAAPRPSALVPLLFFIALCVKEGALVLPAAMVLAHRAFGARSWREVLRGWRAHAPTWAALAAFVALRYAALGGLGGPRGIEVGPGMFLSTLGVYAKLFAWPFSPRVGLGARVDAFGADAAIGAVAVGALALVIWKWRARAAGWAFLGLALLPVSNLAPVSISSLASERLAYLASAGWALGVALALRGLERSVARARPRARTTARALFAVLCAGAAATTSLRAFEWTTPLRFWRDESLRAEPGVPTAHREWVAEAVEARDWDEVRAAVEAMDRHFGGKLTCETATLYGMAIATVGEVERGALIHDRALELCPDLRARGVERVRESAPVAGGLVEEEEFGELAPKWAQAEAVEAADPMLAERLRGVVFQGLAMMREAEAAYRRNLARQDGAATRTDLARFHLARGKYDQAAVELQLALARDADYAPALYWSGFLAAREGRREEAERHLRRVLELDPQMPLADEVRRFLDGGEAPPGDGGGPPPAAGGEAPR